MIKKRYNKYRVSRLLWLGVLLLTFGTSYGQTTFYVTDRVMGNSGSLDVILASAVTSANAGNNVTVYFNVAPDVNGKTYCIISSQLSDVEPTSGSILLTKDPSNSYRQGIQFEETLGFQKMFRAELGTVKITELAIVIKPKQTLAMVAHSELQRSIGSGYAVAVEGKLKFTFDEEYQIESGKYLPYKIYDEDRNLKGSCTLTGTTSGGAQAVSYVFDDNRYTMTISGITGLTTNQYYLLEVETSTQEKRYLRFLYKD